MSALAFENNGSPAERQAAIKRRAKVALAKEPGDPWPPDHWDELLTVYGAQTLTALVFENEATSVICQVMIARRCYRAEHRRRWKALMAPPTETELAFVRRMLAEQGGVPCA
jgi:hypothetical protein